MAAHYHLSIDGVTCCADGTLYDDGAPATWRTLTAARSAPTTPEDSIISCHGSQAESTPPETSSSPADPATSAKASPTPGPWQVVY
ncbi:hypothetical protein LCGC14_2054230, partial [marine sediment metagenome]